MSDPRNWQLTTTFMHRLDPIPASFHSDETGKAFSACCDCGTDLLACEDGYFIQKAYAGKETIMEIAICSDCHGKLQNSYSAESRGAVWDFYLDNGDFSTRLKKFSPLPVGNPDLWTNSCMTCGALKQNTQEHIVAAQCLEGDLVYGETPLMICLACMEKVIELLSEESKGTYDRWMDRVYPQDPGDTGKISAKRRRILV